MTQHGAMHANRVRVLVRETTEKNATEKSAPVREVIIQLVKCAVDKGVALRLHRTTGAGARQSAGDVYSGVAATVAALRSVKNNFHAILDGLSSKEFEALVSELGVSLVCNCHAGKLRRNKRTGPGVRPENCSCEPRFTIVASQGKAYVQEHKGKRKRRTHTLLTRPCLLLLLLSLSSRVLRFSYSFYDRALLRS